MVYSKENYKFDLGVKGLSNLTLSNDINVSLFFKVYRSREGPSHIWSHKKTERQWYGTTYKQTGICKKNLLLMQCWILCEIKTCIRLCNLDRVLLFLLLLTMILNCELVVLRYLKVYRSSIFWCLDVFLWVSCS